MIQFQIKKALIDPNSDHIIFQNGHTSCMIQDEIIAIKNYPKEYYCGTECQCKNLWVFNLKLCKWRKIVTSGKQIPHKLDQHTMNYDPINKQIIIFGGKQGSSFFTKHIYVLNWNTKQWKFLNPIENFSPSPRKTHASAFIHPYLIIDGGLGQDLNLKDDTWVFNLNTYKWTEITNNKPRPKPRFFHTLCIAKNILYIIGGCCKGYNLQTFSMIYSMNLKPLLDDKFYKLGWQKEYLKGYLVRRWGHSNIVLNDQIFLFGGRKDPFIPLFPELTIINPQKYNLIHNKLKFCTNQILQFVRPRIYLYGGYLIVFRRCGNNIYYIDLTNYINKAEIYHLGIISDIIKNIDKKQIPLMKRYQNYQNKPFYLNIVLLNNIFSQVFLSLNFIRQDFLDYITQFSISDIKSILAMIYTGMFNVGKIYLNRIQIDFDFFPSKQNRHIFYRYIQLLEKKKFKFQLSETNYQTSNLGIMKVARVQWQYLRTVSYFYYKDVKFILKNKEQIYSNSLILSIRSEFYKRLLININQKKDGFIIEVDWITPHIFKILLKYIEFDFIIYYKNLQLEESIELFKLAKFFDFPRLERICVVQMNKYICQDSVVKFFQLAQKYDSDMLKKQCSYYFVQNFEAIKNLQQKQLLQMMQKQYEELEFINTQQRLQKMIKQRY